MLSRSSLFTHRLSEPGGPAQETRMRRTSTGWGGAFPSRAPDLRSVAKLRVDRADIHAVNGDGLAVVIPFDRIKFAIGPVGKVAPHVWPMAAVSLDGQHFSERPGLPEK